MSVRQFLAAHTSEELTELMALDSIRAAERAEEEHRAQQERAGVRRPMSA